MSMQKKEPHFQQAVPVVHHATFLWQSAPCDGAGGSALTGTKRLISLQVEDVKVRA